LRHHCNRKSPPGVLSLTYFPFATCNGPPHQQEIRPRSN
jgi:hypothetical protein